MKRIPLFVLGLTVLLSSVAEARKDRRQRGEFLDECVWQFMTKDCPQTCEEQGASEKTCAIICTSEEVREAADKHCKKLWDNSK